MKKNPVIALAGNPNVGKTTLFNSLTGSRQRVGNWPGVTVEYKAGTFGYQGTEYELIDLPGIYSLSASSPDEIVARDFIINEKPDLIVNIVDAANLERNLYLTVQLMEMRVPILLVLSMIDIADQNGIIIDSDHLQSHLGYPVFPVTLNRKFDADALKEAINQSLSKVPSSCEIRYDEIVEKSLENLLSTHSANDATPAGLQRWRFVKLLERDHEESGKASASVMESIEKEIKAIEKHRGQRSEAVIADDRYGFIRGLSKDVLRRKKLSRHTVSDRIDKVVLNGFLGLPVFFFVMYLVFLIAVRFSQPLIELIDMGLSFLLVEQMEALLSLTIIPEWLIYLISEGLGGGITTIGTFVPPIFFIFVSLSILEDSGYMARAAFIADKFMRKAGLPGKAFIPLIVGFGCTVPAIMATRTLESRRDRVFTSLLTPFMSCGAKLPVYAFLVMYFFESKADIVIFSLYMGGVLMALLTALLLKKTLFKTEPGNFVMELPPYHIPTFNGILLHTWHRLKDFVLRAGKTILGVIILINILQVIYVGDPFTKTHANEEPPSRITVLELGGKVIAPVFGPMGIKAENWQASVALLSGLFAKEAVVGSLQSLYGGEEEEVGTNIRAGFGSWQAAYAYLLFVLLYAPCIAAMGMLFKEHGIRWLIFSLIYLTILAWMVATLFYQISTFGAGSIVWIGICVAIAIAFYMSMNYMGRKEQNVIR